MAQKESIVICSTFSRANWLAKELASRGYKTSLIDFTESLGYRAPDTWEPPFGIFESKKISNSQLSWLKESYGMTELKNGFCVLLPDGPVEFQGDLRKFYFNKLNLNSEKIDYLNASLDIENWDRLYNEFQKLTFEDNWVISLAQQLSCAKFNHNYLAMEEKTRPLPILDHWYQRIVTRRSNESEIESLVDRGVDYLNSAKLEDVEVKDQKVLSIQVENKKIFGDRFLWFLSSDELSYLNPKLNTKFLDSNIIKAEWYWTKYRLSLDSGWVYDTLPYSFLIIQDILLPWTHEKLMIIQKGSMKDEFHVWARIPYHKRFETTYHDKMKAKISDAFEKKFPEVKVTDFEMPFEYKKQLGPVPIPVYSTEQIKQFKPRTFHNFIWYGPEVWDRLDWEYLLGLQDNILNQIRDEQMKRDTIRRRGRDLEIYS